MHGGGPNVTPGATIPKEYREENLELLEKGLCNLRAHIRLITEKFGVKLVVAVNQFATDTVKELELVKSAALAAGATNAAIANHWALGSDGAVDLANAVVKACDSAPKREFRFLYDVDLSVKVKNNCFLTLNN